MTTPAPGERGDDVEVATYIDASPEIVFSYFTDPERMCRWMGVTAELDAREGGEFRIDVTNGDVAVGTYVEVVPPERVVLSWGWEGHATVPPGSTTVEVTLTPDGDGTLVRLRHSGLDVTGALRHNAGWTHYLARLSIASSGGEPGPDPNVSS
jgi:uncharacterized protein YndB with AHSA1/START domain